MYDFDVSGGFAVVVDFDSAEKCLGGVDPVEVFLVERNTVDGDGNERLLRILHLVNLNSYFMRALDKISLEQGACFTIGNQNRLFGFRK